jgi:hypothetical protein
MEYNTSQGSLSRPLMSAVFAGIISTVICLFYNILYRDITDFELADIINVSSLIFLINLLFLGIGFLYYFFINKVKRGEAFFIALCVLLTLFFIWKAEGVKRAASLADIREFRGLLVGILIIIGLCATVLIPYVFHSKRFDKELL